MHIKHMYGGAKPPNDDGRPFLTRTPAIVMTPAGSRSPAGRWLMTRSRVSPAFADLLAELAGFGVGEASDG